VIDLEGKNIQIVCKCGSMRTSITRQDFQALGCSK